MITKDEILRVLDDIGVLVESSESPEGYIINVEDSLSYISTIVELENAFEIEFYDDDLTGYLFNSVDKLATIINERIQQN